MKLDVKEFIENFDIRNNAMDMRTLTRWNGRDLREKENVAEHTHLVVACAIYLYDKYNGKEIGADFSNIIRLCMLHDSLELLRGDILSVTKDAIDGLRAKTDNEERIFMTSQVRNVSSVDEEIVRLADLMACYLFVKRELRYPCNDFTTRAYLETKKTFDDAFNRFKHAHNIQDSNVVYPTYAYTVKGYKDDAGLDVVLSEDVTFLPRSTSVINLHIRHTPEPGTMSQVVSRTSAAIKGLYTSNSPIDAGYTGEIHAICHNASNDIIEYKTGESFCQIVSMPIIQHDAESKREGARGENALGSSDARNN